MKIRQITKYPVTWINRTWIGDFAKLVRVAFTPLQKTKSDRYVTTFRKPNLLEAKAGMKRITTAKHLREVKKKVLEYAFRP